MLVGECFKFFIASGFVFDFGNIHGILLFWLLFFLNNIALLLYDKFLLIISNWGLLLFFLLLLIINFSRFIPMLTCFCFFWKYLFFLVSIDLLEKSCSVFFEIEIEFFVSSFWYSEFDLSWIDLFVNLLIILLFIIY